MNLAADVLPVLASLGVVLGIFLLAARFAPRLLAAVTPSSQRGRVQACIALGPRERLVVVEYGGETLMLGVAPGRVSLLKSLPRGDAAPLIAERKTSPDRAELN